jgi:EmrB/QacA subfamily drug resistance transporter
VPGVRLDDHWKVFTIVAAAVAMASMDGGMVPIIFPSIETTFAGTPSTTLSWVFTAYTIGLAAFVVASGRLADRTGRRRIFIIGTVVFVVGSGLCGLAPTPGLLIAARFVQGTGHALFTPASLGLVLAVWPAERRTAAIGAWIAAGGIASGMGPSIGAAVDHFLHWRVAFFLNVVVGVPVVIRAFRVLVDTETREDAKIPDPVGIGLLAGTLGLVALVIVQGRTWGWTSSGILTSAALSVILGAAFARRSRRHPSPVIDPTLFRGRTYRLSLVVSMLISMAMFANLVMQAQFLQKAWGYDSLKAGLAVTPLPIAAGLTAPFAGRLAGRFGHRPLILAGLAMTACGLFAYAVLPDGTPDYAREFLPGVLLAGVGTWGLAISMINAAAVDDMSSANFGVGTAVLQTARQAGGILGIALFFGMYGTPEPDRVLDTFRNLWLLFALLPTAAFLLALRLPKKSGGRVVAPASP